MLAPLIPGDIEAVTDRRLRLRRLELQVLALGEAMRELIEAVLALSKETDDDPAALARRAEGTLTASHLVEPVTSDPSAPPDGPA
jgi:hypothetical protein